MKSNIELDELSYLDFFGFSNNPFPVAPGDVHFYSSGDIEQIVAEIVHGVVSRKGFMVLTGEIGLGKTTISRRIISILGKKNIETSLVLHTVCQDVELLLEINRDFGLKTKKLSLGYQLTHLNQFLLDQNSQNKNCVIIIDDAQNLNHQSFELVRMISNLEANQQKLVQIVLIGQPELMVKLNSNELRQLRSRIIIKKEVTPLSPEEVKDYLLFKLSVSGSSVKTTINENSYKMIFRFTKGNLRQLNVLMDRCLYVAFLHNTTQISKQVIKEAYIDLAPAKYKPARKVYSLIPATALMLFVVSGILYYPVYRNIFLNDIKQQPLKIPLSKKPLTDRKVYPAYRLLPGNEEQELFSKEEAPIVEMPDIDKFEIKNFGPEKINPKTNIPKPVVNFLKNYELIEFKQPFWQALKTDKFENLTQTIFDETGYKLIRFDHISDHIKKKYGMLSYRSENQGKETFFLFWKPRFEVKKFYYSYKGREIKQLQRRLADIGLYKSGLDEIVGRNVMLALNSFQKDMGLPITGYPDDITVFLLCHQKGSERQ